MSSDDDCCPEKIRRNLLYDLLNEYFDDKKLDKIIEQIMEIFEPPVEKYKRTHTIHQIGRCWCGKVHTQITYHVAENEKIGVELVDLP